MNSLKKHLILLLLVLTTCCFISCKSNINDTTKESETANTLSTGTETEATIYTENTQADQNETDLEEEGMTREVNTVCEISDFLYIKRQSGEIIKLDLSANNNFKVDDLVFVIYKDSTLNEDGTYSVNLHTIRIFEQVMPNTSNF